MSEMHYGNQVLAECPECGQSIRLKPNRGALPDSSQVTCGGCGARFTASRETGEVLDG